MRYANMMWRCKLIIFCFAFFAFSLNAQKEIDTLFFVWNATAVQKLKPTEGMQISDWDFARDSAAFYEGAAGKTLTISMGGTHYEGGKQKPYSQGYYRYVFDDESRPTEYSHWQDSSFVYGYRYSYRINLRLEKTIFRNQWKNDTTNYAYDKTGNFAGECVRDSCTQRLYDSKQRIIVLRNSFYGKIRGDFTYEYNEEGKLIRRRFLESQSGIVLCTDTIEFRFEDLEKRYLTKKHSIRITGREGWITIDEIKIDRVLHKTISYELFHGPGAPEKTNYFYDEAGFLNSRQTTSAKFKTEDIYHLHPAADTIQTYRLVEEKNGIRKILWSETIITYDASGLIAGKKRKEYRIRKVKRKWEVVLSEEHISTCRWN